MPVCIIEKIYDLCYRKVLFQLDNIVNTDKQKLSSRLKCLCSKITTRIYCRIYGKSIFIQNKSFLIGSIISINVLSIDFRFIANY